MEIKSFGLNVNHNEHSEEIAGKLTQLLLSKGFKHDQEDPDLWIAIGGDGSFLRMVRETSFSAKAYYVGIHTGTLGFLQEISPDELEEFADKLVNKKYRIVTKDLACSVIEKDDEKILLNSLNEIVIRNRSLKALGITVYVDGELLETFAGDGLLVATSVGSSAYNMSFQGALVDHQLATMQLTPIAPLTNKHYHNLSSSLILPDTRTLTLIPSFPELIITTDGENHEFSDIRKITVTMKKEALSILTFGQQSFISKIREKLLI